VVLMNDPVIDGAATEDPVATTTAADDEAPLAPPPRWRSLSSALTAGLPAPFWWLWLGTLVNRAGTFVEPFFLLYLTGPRHESARTAGLVLTAWGVGSVLSAPLGGYLTDRFGRRATLGFSLAVTAAALMGLGLARNLALITVLGFAVGTVGDMYRPAATAAIADVVAAPSRERAYALQFWAINLGFSISSVAAGLLLHVGFGTLFVLDALTTLAFGVLALRFIPETRPQASAEQPRARLADPLRLLGSDRLLLGCALVVLVYAILYSQVTVVLPLAIRHAGLSASVFGYVVAVNGIAIIVLQPFAIGWLERVPRRLTLPGGVALVGVGLATTVLCHTAWQFAASVLLWTLGEIAVSGSFQALIAALAPEHMRGRYAGAVGLAWGAAGLAAPLLGTTGYSYSPALTGCACVAAGIVAAAGQVWVLDGIDRRRAAASA
jgi:MFS family permease